MSETEVRRSDIAIMKSDGTNKKLLTNETTSEQLGVKPDYGFYGPAWSPDDSKIAFNAAGCLALMNRRHSLNSAYPS